jgi:hypothetical protein
MTQTIARTQGGRRVNRNILTDDDVPEANLESNAPQELGATVADDYWGRLVKYVPIEIIGAYMIVSGVVDTAYADSMWQRRLALGILGAAGVIASWFFALRVLKVVRRVQLMMTGLAFAVWSFATGGVFSTMDWWQPWMGTIAVVVFGVAVRIVGLGPLPEARES